MSKIYDFFSKRTTKVVEFFSKKEKEPKFFPCDFQKCTDCVYWDFDKTECGIDQEHRDVINTHHRSKGIEAFKRK